MKDYEKQLLMLLLNHRATTRELFQRLTDGTKYSTLAARMEVLAGAGWVGRYNPATDKHTNDGKHPSHSRPPLLSTGGVHPKKVWRITDAGKQALLEHLRATRN